jgi:hypothetical protein
MFDPVKLRKVVRHLARELPALMEEFDFDTIAVTGKSGIAVGFALSMITGVHVVAVRKGESSHGDMIEGDGHKFERYAFFDDTIASGATRDRVQIELDQRANTRPGCTPCRRVLNILYAEGFRGESLDHPDTPYGTPTYRVPSPECIDHIDGQPFDIEVDTNKF